MNQNLKWHGPSLSPYLSLSWDAKSQNWPLITRFKGQNDEGKWPGSNRQATLIGWIIKCSLSSSPITEKSPKDISVFPTGDKLESVRGAGPTADRLKDESPEWVSLPQRQFEAGRKLWRWIMVCHFYSRALCFEVWQCTVQHAQACMRQNWLLHSISSGLRRGQRMGRKKEAIWGGGESLVLSETFGVTSETLKRVIDLTLRQTAW